MIVFPLLNSLQQEHGPDYYNMSIKEKGTVKQYFRPLFSNDVARTFKKYAYQRETTVSINDSLQLRPFSKWEPLLKEIICSKRERILSLKSSS